MKTVTAAMSALFLARQWYAAKLFAFTLIDGTVLNYCSGDIDLVVGGTTYLCGGQTGPYWDRASNKAKATFGLGAQVTQLTFDAMVGSGTVEGFPFAVAVRYGLFDGADLQYSRINMATPGNTSAGAVPMFGGRVADISYSNSIATFTCNSYLELLDQNLPRNLFQTGCNNTLFDLSCTLSQAFFSFAGSVIGSPLPYLFAFSGGAASEPTGYFNLGKLLFTSGANAGFWRSVQNHVNGSPSTIAVFPPYAAAPAIGDAFIAVAGCDKQQITCAVKFNNFANFRGTPYVPPAETAV